MPTRVRPAELGASDARRLVASIGADVREARLIAGVSQAVVARAAGVSPSTLSRIERGVTRDLRLAPVCRAARALGLAPSFRLFPVGLPVRDAAQLALLQRLEAVLGPPLHLRREVPMPIQGDPRAWDAVIEGGDGAAFVEAESHMRDVQAFERRVGLKARDDPRSMVVILVATRSAHNRRVVAEHREALRELFPLDGAAILRCLRVGRRPPLGGIVLL